jgi:long-chain acyl-CoA synthetase
VPAEVASARSATGAEREPRTVAALWRRAAAAGRSNPAYLVETDHGWRAISWAEGARRVEDLAFGLLALGVEKGDVFAIVSTTRLEWSLIDFALGLVGGISAPIYPSSTPRETAYLLAHSESIGVFVEDEEQRAKVDGVRRDAPAVQHVISFTDLSVLEQRGREYRHRTPGALDEALAAIDEDDLFTYIYTSGTTGPPKGCMIRHRNYYEMVTTVNRLERLVSEDDVVLLWLPLAHNFGRLLHLLAPHAGYTLAFVPDPYRVADALPHVRPTILPSAPRLYEKMYATVKARLDEASGARRRLVDWALRVGYRVSEHRQRGRPLPRALALQHRVADRLVYSQVKARVGGRLRFGISGAAPLAPEIGAFFHALDILILEGYGQTELTTACSVNRPDRFRFGTVGPPLPGFEIRIADDGEIVVRSETVFAGYLKDEAATREVLDEDGWLRTGDVGELDEDGFLTITDRKRDIIVTAGGKNVAPQNIENALKRSKLLSHALVVGDRRPYLTALVTLDEEAARAWARERGLDGDAEALSRDERVRAAVQEIVDEVNAERARFEQVKRFAILPRDFSAERDEVTPTLKLRRRACEEHFAGVIDELYEAPAAPS